jgi:hypothetical protein
MKLNGWQRIAIVVSVSWFLGSFVFLSHEQDQSWRDSIALTVDSCNTRYLQPPNSADLKGYQACLDRETPPYPTLARTWPDILVVGLIPIPLGWGFAYLVLFIVRWIRKGFAPKS